MTNAVKSCLIVTLAIWHFGTKSLNAEAKDPPPKNIQIVKDENELPEQVLSVKQALSEAASNGDIEELRDLFEANELAPVIGDNHTGDPIDYWKSHSIDQSARDYMAALAEILALPPVKTSKGNYIWPYLAKIPLDKLGPEGQIDLFRLAGPRNASEMLKSNTYTHYEILIGTDGTWHHFILRNHRPASNK